MKNDIHARHSRTGNVTAADSHDSLHVTPHYIRLVILNSFKCNLKCQCLMKVFSRNFFNEWIINECVVSVSVSRHRIRSISFWPRSRSNVRYNTDFQKIIFDPVHD